MSEKFDPTDHSFVVKRRGTPQKPWRWEIYCAGKSAPVERSTVFFESMAEAVKERKKALGRLLAKRAAEIASAFGLGQVRTGKWAVAKSASSNRFDATPIRRGCDDDRAARSTRVWDLLRPS